MTGALRMMEVQARAYRRTWRGSVITAFLNPILYLAALGIGLGQLVDEGTGTASLGDVSYVAFLAPGLLAATAMQIATGDASYPVMAGMKWTKTYHAALSTPISSRDLVLGHLSWVTIRVAFTTVVFGLIMALFGATTISAAMRAWLPAILIGLVFAALVTGYAGRLENDYGLAALFRFGIIPMFLFSGTFFPIAQLPGWMQPVAFATPLWHGVELSRAAALGTETTWHPMLHVSYLLVLIVIGTAFALRVFKARLIK